MFYFGIANGDRDAQPVLTELTALRSYSEQGSPVKSYVYVDDRGRQEACYPWSPAPDEKSEWNDELLFSVCQ